MKYIILVITFFLPFDLLFAQNWQKAIGDDWFNTHTGLAIGEKIPDIPLGEVLNNKTGKTRFSQFKGKLIILDFWDTGCSACFAAFPKMEQLQKEFGQYIQVFLVNPTETKDEITGKINKHNTRADGSKRTGLFSLPASLPVITNAKELGVLFPTRVVPHHVWLDKNGRVAQKGSQLVSYPEKIKNFLDGNKVLVMYDDNTSPQSPGNSKAPSYFNIAGQSGQIIPFGSFFTGYNAKYAALTGTQIQHVIDSISKTIRNTYINQSVLDLYRVAFSETINRNFNKTIFNSVYRDFALSYIRLNVNDRLACTNLLPTGKYVQKDSDYIKSLYCYEQIAPVNSLPGENKSRMIADLNQYFSNEIGVSGSIQRNKVTCYTLVRTSKLDKISVKQMDNWKTEEPFVRDGVKVTRWKGASMKEILNGALEGSQLLKRLFDADKETEIFFMDESAIYGHVSITLPDVSELHSLDDLNRFLSNYDLSLVWGERELDFVVISDAGDK